MWARYDLVAIGGGLAGMTAAVRGAELGLRVAVVEKGTQTDYLCNTRVSGGVFHIAYGDVKMPRDELLRSAQTATGEIADSVLLDVLVEEGARAVDWLREKGARFVRGPNRAWLMAPPRPAATRLDAWRDRGPDLVLRNLTNALTKAGGDLLLGCRARELLIDSGRCIGLQIDHGTETADIHCAAVVIADGGFQANLRMMASHIGPTPERIFQRNARVSIGDGLLMAQKAGAVTTELDRFYGHLLSIDAFGNDELWPFPQLDHVGAAGMIVGRDGRRLFDEGLGGIYAANMLAGLDDPLCATVICDEAIWATAGTQALIPPNALLEQKGGTIHRSATVENLAVKAGIDALALAQTIQLYNEAVRAGTEAKLSPPRTSEKAAPRPISAPYIAIPICPGITNTMGGLRIDAHARVLGAQGMPIPGLYAAGAATGGLEGGPRAAYIGGLSRAGVFGLRAAEHASSFAAA